MGRLTPAAECPQDTGEQMNHSGEAAENQLRMLETRAERLGDDDAGRRPAARLELDVVRLRVPVYQERSARPNRSGALC